MSFFEIGAVMNNKFIVYIVGAVILTGGALFAGHLLGVPPLWLLAAGIILMGFAVLAASSRLPYHS